MTEVTDNFDPIDKERHNALMDQFLDMTPNEAGQWIDDNVVDFQSGKLALKRLTKIVNALAHKVTGE